MEDAEAGSGEGSSGASAAERGVMRDTLRELLFEIPGFQTLAERGIPRELIPDPPAGASPSGLHEPASESGGSRPSAGEVSSSSGTSKKGKKKKTQGGGIQPLALSQEAGIQLHLSPLGMMAWLRPAPTNTYLALDKGEGVFWQADSSGEVEGV